MDEYPVAPASDPEENRPLSECDSEDFSTGWLRPQGGVEDKNTLQVCFDREVTKPAGSKPHAEARVTEPEAELPTTHVNPPRQERSRKSFERALDAAVALLVERGNDSFTLAEVAEKAALSTGSIYGRVKSKDDLLRSAQLRELARIEKETDVEFGKLEGEPIDLYHAVGFAIDCTAVVLRRNAPILSAFMLRANSDPFTARAGQQSHGALVARFVGVVLMRSQDINNPDPAEAVDWTFTVVYSVIARYLGLGSSTESARQGDWVVTLTNLTDMTVSFLTTQPLQRRVTGRSDQTS